MLKTNKKLKKSEVRSRFADAMSYVFKRWPSFKLKKSMIKGHAVYSEPTRVIDSMPFTKHGNPQFFIGTGNRASIEFKHGCGWDNEGKRILGMPDYNYLPGNPLTFLARFVERMSDPQTPYTPADIIAVYGPAFAGKSTIANAIAKNCVERRWGVARVLPMALPVKQIAMSIGWNGEKDDKGRKLLQTLGSDCGRAYNPFTWANKWVDSAYDFQKSRVIIVDDVRFTEEMFMIYTAARLLNARFTAIKVVTHDDERDNRRKAAGMAEVGKHDSETGGAALAAQLKTPYFKPGVVTMTINNTGKFDPEFGSSFWVHRVKFWVKEGR